ncbi:MAG: fumarylacetoacetate hydrolase family protein [Thermomicrobiales bacterium]|nr:fumarylacetoacetate hydrolase family protein [Thermomicrobiales bacterium]
MALCIYQIGVDGKPLFGLIDGEEVIDIEAAGGPATLGTALQLSKADLDVSLARVKESDLRTPLAEVTLNAPIDWQEVWCAGVTYLRSRDARMEESQEKNSYDRVYEADRPELFFKGMRFRVSGPGEEIAVRSDSTWDVPEPECALVTNSAGEIIGYTIGNDVSSRSIEGENPLYLPQAKVYDKAAALGPVIALHSEIDDPNSLAIELVIRRGGEIGFQGTTNTNQLHRTFDDLVRYLYLDNTHYHGAILMTGTGIVPPSEFTLEAGDEVSVTIDGIGTLTNPVIRLGA